MFVFSGQSGAKITNNLLRALYNYHMQREARRYAKLYVFRHESSIVRRLDTSISADKIHVTHPRGMRLYHLSLKMGTVAHRGIQLL